MKLLATLFFATALSGSGMPQQIDPRVEPTPEMHQEAKRNPNGWVYVIQGNYGPSNAVPPEAIAGAWRVDASGSIVKDSYVANPKFNGAP